MALYFDDPEAHFCPDDNDEDVSDMYSHESAGIHRRGPPVGEIKGLPAKAPKASEWRPLTDKTVSITVDLARDMACNQAQHEVDFIKQNVRNKMDTREIRANDG